MQRLNVFLSGEEYWVYINKIKNRNNFSIERHSNAYFELHVALRGAASLYVANKELELFEGDSILISPGQYHCFKNSSEDFEHFVLNFSCSQDKEFTAFSNEKIRLDEFQLSLCRKILCESENDNLFKGEIISKLYQILFIEVMRNRLKESKKIGEFHILTIDSRLGIIDNFFENSFEGDATETKLSKMVNLSRRQLARVLKTHYGQTFREKLKSARMDFAAWLLKTTDFSVSEIGRRSGYESETAFLRTFKDYYGVTPTNYRKEGM